MLHSWPLWENTCVRQVVLDKRLPLGMVSFALGVDLQSRGERVAQVQGIPEVVRDGTLALGK